MNNLPNSTFKILWAKAFDHPIEDSWVDWAIEMIESGYRLDCLYELAGITLPYDQPEVQRLTTRVLQELKLDYSDKLQIVRNYAIHLIESALDCRQDYLVVLYELREIYFELDMSPEFQDFTLLFWAKEDLIQTGVQHYWRGANVENVDNIIEEKFKGYLQVHSAH